MISNISKLLVFTLLFSCSTLSEDDTQIKSSDLPTFSPNEYVCYKTESPLIIDGKGDEQAWRNAGWTDYFVDIEGGAKQKPEFQTRAKMLWDDDYLYFFAMLEEPHVWANLTKRDSVIFYDNDFEIFIDPDGDTHCYYELELNALNTVWDLFLDKPYRDSCRPMFFWDIRGLKSAVSVDGTINNPSDRDKGWSVELAMPWSVLKECAPKNNRPNNGDQWRINFSRVEWRIESKADGYEKIKNPETGKNLPEQNWVWSPQGVINMHCPETWGYVQFSDLIAGSGQEDFIKRPSETAKWALRQVYYKLKDYFKKHGRYTSCSKKLGLPIYKVKRYNWPPKIEFTESLFEASLKSEDGIENWRIRQDGLVWKQ